MNEKLKRVHVQVYEKDWDELFRMYGGQVKRSNVIRDLVRGWVVKMRAKQERQEGGIHVGQVNEQ